MIGSPSLAIPSRTPLFDSIVPGHKSIELSKGWSFPLFKGTQRTKTNDKPTPLEFPQVHRESQRQLESLEKIIEDAKRREDAIRKSHRIIL